MLYNLRITRRLHLWNGSVILVYIIAQWPPSQVLLIGEIFTIIIISVMKSKQYHIVITTTTISKINHIKSHNWYSQTYKYTCSWYFQTYKYSWCSQTYKCKTTHFPGLEFKKWRSMKILTRFVVYYIWNQENRDFPRHFIIYLLFIRHFQGPSWSWSHSSWMNN